MNKRGRAGSGPQISTCEKKLCLGIVLGVSFLHGAYDRIQTEANSRQLEIILFRIHSLTDVTTGGM